MNTDCLWKLYSTAIKAEQAALTGEAAAVSKVRGERVRGENVGGSRGGNEGASVTKKVGGGQGHFEVEAVLWLHKVLFETVKVFIKIGIFSIILLSCVSKAASQQKPQQTIRNNECNLSHSHCSNGIRYEKCNEMLRPRIWWHLFSSHEQSAKYVSAHIDAELATKENMLFSATDLVYGKVCNKNKLL